MIMENKITLSISLKEGFDLDAIGKALALLLSQTESPNEAIEALQAEAKAIREENARWAPQERAFESDFD